MFHDGCRASAEQGVDGNERDIERPAQTLSQAAGNAQSGKGAGAGSEGNSLKSFTAAACSSQTAADHSENDFRVFLSGLGLKVAHRLKPVTATEHRFPEDSRQSNALAIQHSCSAEYFSRSVIKEKRGQKHSLGRQA